MLFAGFIEGRCRHGSLRHKRSLGRIDLSAVPGPTSSLLNTTSPIAGGTPIRRVGVSSPSIKPSLIVPLLIPSGRAERKIQEIFRIRTQYRAKTSQDVWEVEPGSPPLPWGKPWTDWHDHCVACVSKWQMFDNELHAIQFGTRFARPGSAAHPCVKSGQIR
jgi:hypothetical protein